MKHQSFFFSFVIPVAYVTNDWALNLRMTTRRDVKLCFWWICSQSKSWQEADELHMVVREVVEGEWDYKAVSRTEKDIILTTCLLSTLFIIAIFPTLY